MIVDLPEFSAAMPEMFMLGLTCLVLFVDIFMTARTRVITYGLTQASLIFVFVLTLFHFAWQPVVTFHGNFIADSFASFCKLVMILLTFFVFIYSRAYIKYRNITGGEYYILGLFSLLGMMVMVSAHSFLTLYLGTELLSLPLYAMVALRRESLIASEAALKYFVTGAIASGMLLYGLSLLYGATGHIELASAAARLSAGDKVALVGLVFVVTGLLFKLGAVPFHMWVPDVYHGAPATVTAFITGAPKIAALAIVYRLLVEGMPTLVHQWQQVLIIVAILSMFFGNLLAIAQANVKRMFAYSSIAHMGYMLLGVIAATPAGYSAALLYGVVYAVMAVGGFAVIAMMSKVGFEAEFLDDFRGLNARHPWLAFILLICLFSMAGVPPVIGFFAKLGVIEALISVHLVWLAAVAVIFAIIGAYYYLRLVKVMYFEEPSKMSAIRTSKDALIAVSLNGLVLLVMGIFPSQLITLTRHVFGA